MLCAFAITVKAQAMRNKHNFLGVRHFADFAIFGDSTDLGNRMGSTFVVLVFSGKPFCLEKIVHLFGMINSIVLWGHFLNTKLNLRNVAWQST